MLSEMFLFSVVLAVMGGYVRFVRTELEDEPLMSRKLFNSLVIAAFSGLIVCSLMSFIGLENKDMQSVFSGVAGYGGPAFLDDIVSRVYGLFISKLSNKKGLEHGKDEEDIVKAMSNHDNA